jgi:hypothetical protein
MTVPRLVVLNATGMFLTMNNPDIYTRYRGLKPKDVDEGNPNYSCVICSKLGTCNNKAYRSAPIDSNGMIARAVDKPSLGCSCPECDPISETDFAMRYDFGIDTASEA